MKRAAAPIDVDTAWAMVLGLRRLAQEGVLPNLPFGATLIGAVGLELCDPSDRRLCLRVEGSGRWSSPLEIAAAVEQIFDLYLDLAMASEPLAIGHLGQSLDGRIATASGASSYVTGAENILHLHRMRALCDAVVVGARTVAHDDPQLTTRLVTGSHAVRVVLDPGRRLPRDRKVFQDHMAPTRLVCDQAGLARNDSFHGSAEVIGVGCGDGGLALDEALAALRAQGLRSLFVEGGGRTVSSFLQAGLLDRLQIAVAPLIIGSGRQGLDLPPVESLAAAIRPTSRTFKMGSDVLFDCDLR